MHNERKKWNTNKLDQAMKEAKEEFIELQMQLHHLLVKICLRALKTFQQGKSEPLNPLQIRQIVEHELDNIVEDISKPNFMDVTLKRTILEWEKLHEKKKED
jgi:hypothetical protein